MVLPMIPVVISGAMVMCNAMELAAKVLQEPGQRATIERQLTQHDAHFQRTYDLALKRMKSDEESRKKMFKLWEQKEANQREMQLLSTEMNMIGMANAYNLDEKELNNKHTYSMAGLELQKIINQSQNDIQQIGIQGQLNNESLQILLRNSEALTNQACRLMETMRKNPGSATSDEEKFWGQIEKIQEMSSNLVSIASKSMLEQDELLNLKKLNKELENENNGLKKLNVEKQAKIDELNNELVEQEKWWSERKNDSEEKLRSEMATLKQQMNRAKVFFNKELFVAIAENNFENAKRLLTTSCADANAVNEAGAPAIIFATIKGNYEMVILLLENGASIDAVDPDKKTALHTAILQKNYKLGEFLVKKGANLNFKNKYGNTPLHFAASVNHPDFVRMFLNAGANLNSKNNCQCTPIHEASGRGNDAIVQMFIHAGANLDSRDKYDWTPLMEAAFRGHRSTVELLLEAGVSFLTKGRWMTEESGECTVTALHLAGCRAELAVMGVLINAARQRLGGGRINNVQVRQFVNAQDRNGNTVTLYAAWAASRRGDQLHMLKHLADKYPEIDLSIENDTRAKAGINGRLARELEVDICMADAAKTLQLCEFPFPKNLNNHIGNDDCGADLLHLMLLRALAERLG